LKNQRITDAEVFWLFNILKTAYL